MRVDVPKYNAETFFHSDLREKVISSISIIYFRSLIIIVSVWKKEKRAVPLPLLDFSD